MLDSRQTQIDSTKKKNKREREKQKKTHWANENEFIFLVRCDIIRPIHRQAESCHFLDDRFFHRSSSPEQFKLPRSIFGLSGIRSFHFSFSFVCLPRLGACVQVCVYRAQLLLCVFLDCTGFKSTILSFIPLPRHIHTTKIKSNQVTSSMYLFFSLLLFFIVIYLTHGFRYSVAPFCFHFTFIYRLLLIHDCWIDMCECVRTFCLLCILLNIHFHFRYF